MTNKLKVLAASGVVALSMVVTPAVTSAHGARGEWRRWRDDRPTANLVETAVAVNQQTGEFSTLIAAVSCTNLVNRLQKDHHGFTVFAPTDAAFAKLGLNAGNVCSALPKKDLSNILRYHVTRGFDNAEEVLASRKLWMLNGQKAVISGATIDGQNIIQTDVMASNGIIHVIDGVMTP